MRACVLAQAHPSVSRPRPRRGVADTPLPGVAPPVSVFWPSCREVVVLVVFTPEPRPCAPQCQGHGFITLHAGHSTSSRPGVELYSPFHHPCEPACEPCLTGWVGVRACGDSQASAPQRKGQAVTSTIAAGGVTLAREHAARLRGVAGVSLVCLDLTRGQWAKRCIPARRSPTRA
jgi:hypothetical protein